MKNTLKGNFVGFTDGDSTITNSKDTIQENIIINNKQQTAVEWYISKIKEARNFCDDPTMEMDIRHTLEVLIKKGEQAKEMEKEQIKDAYWNGSDGIKTKTQILNEAEQFFNETYGGNK